MVSRNRHLRADHYLMSDLGGLQPLLHTGSEIQAADLFESRDPVRAFRRVDVDSELLEKPHGFSEAIAIDPIGRSSGEKADKFQYLQNGRQSQNPQYCHVGTALENLVEPTEIDFRRLQMVNCACSCIVHAFSPALRDERRSGSEPRSQAFARARVSGGLSLATGATLSHPRCGTDAAAPNDPADMYDSYQAT